MNLEQIIENNRITQDPELDLGNINSRHELVDISLLANLTHLEKLYIVYLKIEDLSPLQNLHQLKELVLKNNKITDISPLFKLTNIEYLDLDSNEISDTSTFEIENSSLTTLWLCHNIGIRDFSFLHYLPKTLTRLQLIDSSINDFSFLHHLPKTLTKLELADFYINDFSFLERIAKTIIDLCISGTQMKDFSFIKDFPIFEKLTHLDLSSNLLQNTDFVEYLPVLEYLRIYSNNISIIKIKNAHNIKQISLLENPLTKIIIENSNAFLCEDKYSDYFPLEDFKYFEIVYDEIYTQRLFENAKETVSFTAKPQSKIKHTDLPNVTELIFEGDENIAFSSDGFATNEECLTVDIAELVIFNPKIKTLVLQHVATKNIQALENLRYLTSLIISRPKISIGLLPKMKKLKFIDVSGRFDILELAGDNFPSLTRARVHHGEIKAMILRDLPKFVQFERHEGVENLSIVNCPLLNEISLASDTNDTNTILKNLPALENVKIIRGGNANLLFMKDVMHIKKLDLSSCGNITHFEIIKELKNLINFSYGEHSYQAYQASKQKDSRETLDLSLFEDLTKLKYLRLNSQNITDISPLKKLKKLKTLDLCYNKITDISVVKHLPNLTKLDLRCNQIEDISAISALNKLKDLELHDNQIQDFSVIKSLKFLEEVSISKNSFPLPPARWLVRFIHDRSTHNLPELPFAKEIWQLIASESDFEELAKQLAQGQNWSKEDITAYFAFRT